MQKLTALLILFFFGSTAITTVHSFSDFQEHFFHLLLIGTMSGFTLWLLYKDSLKIKFNKSYDSSKLKILVILLLFTFSAIRVVPCHLIVSGPQDITHANIINHPCSSSTTCATPEITIAHSISIILQIQQNPYIKLLPLSVSHLSNKSPPSPFV